MRKARILLVDDSVVVRRIVSDVLSQDPMLEMAGTAPNGKIGLAKITQVNPDIVVLDIDMPEMDGLQTLTEIRKTYPQLPVIMLSAPTEHDAAATLDALALGANDYLAKPTHLGSIQEAHEVLREELVPRIKEICCRTETLKNPVQEKKPIFSLLFSLPEKHKPLSRPHRTGTSRIDVVAIGVSTGGPNALCEVIPKLSPDFPVPVVIVQHMPAMFTKLLAERLNSQCEIDVHEGGEGDDISPGHAYIAPGNHHMVLKQEGTSTCLSLNQCPPENSCRPAVDVLFRSVVDLYGERTLGVIMTGMGSDGFRGCERIRDAGGQIVVQDQATSVVWGMPGCVARAGLADKILPLNAIADEINLRVHKGRG